MEKQPNADKYDSFDGNVAYPDEFYDNLLSRSSTASSSRSRVKRQSEAGRQIPRIYHFLSVESLDSKFRNGAKVQDSGHCQVHYESGSGSGDDNVSYSRRHSPQKPTLLIQFESGYESYHGDYGGGYCDRNTGSRSSGSSYTSLDGSSVSPSPSVHNSHQSV